MRWPRTRPDHPDRPQPIFRPSGPHPLYPKAAGQARSRSIGKCHRLKCRHAFRRTQRATVADAVSAARAYSAVTVGLPQHATGIGDSSRCDEPCTSPMPTNGFRPRNNHEPPTSSLLSSSFRRDVDSITPSRFAGEQPSQRAAHGDLDIGWQARNVAASAAAGMPHRDPEIPPSVQPRRLFLRPPHRTAPHLVFRMISRA